MVSANLDARIRDGFILLRQNFSCWHPPQHSLYPRLQESCMVVSRHQVCQQHFQRLSFFSLFPSCVQIFLPNTGAPLTQPPDGFSRFGSHASHAIPGSTPEWKRSTCGSSLNLWFNARWVNQQQCLSLHCNKQSAERSRERAGIGWWGEHRRTLSWAGGNATSTGLTSRWEWGFFAIVVALKRFRSSSSYWLLTKMW